MWGYAIPLIGIGRFTWRLTSKGAYKMIRLIKPYIAYHEVEKDFQKIFESGIFTKGEYVTRFIADLRTYIGAEHAFLATSATTALTVCLKLLEIGPGDEVIVADFSFPATVNVVEDVGAKPVFADVDSQTFNMTPDELEAKITDKTKAVIFVDALGNPSGIGKIKEICQARGIPLIDDAACALGSSENGIKSGSIADLTCFSFHPRKLLTMGEGGAIATNNPEFAHKLAIKLNHGATMVDGKVDFIDFGFNYRMPDLQCVMGIKQLQKLDNIVTCRMLLQSQFHEALRPLGFKKQAIFPNVVHNVQSLAFVVPEQCDRDGLISYLAKHNIETTIGTYCLSNTTYYRNKYKQVQTVANYLGKNTITLPCYDGVEWQYICDKIQDYMKLLG